MAIGTSDVNFGSLQTEYGGSNPISFSEYYRGGSFVLAHPGNASLAASGAISVSAFFNQSKRWIVAVTISASTTNFNLRTFLDSTYGDYSSIPTDVTVTINSGVVVYSTSTSTPAFDTGNGWESSSTITIVNNGQISGMGGDGGVGYNGAGGAGGNAIGLQYPLTINNTSGNIFGGGGGGGGGGGMYWASNGSIYASGGGGGGGQSYQASAGGGIPYGQNLTSIGYTVTQNAAAGSNGGNGGAGAGGVGFQVTSGGESPTYPTAGTGGTGGVWAAAGSNGGIASNGGDGAIIPNGLGVGGAGGKAIELNGFTATFTGGNNGTQVQGAQSTQTGTDTTFTQYSNGRRIYLVTLNTGKSDFNLYTHVGSPSGVVCDVTVNINSGIVVYSTSTSTPAFTTGSGWGSTTTIAIINNGYILGIGGAGGAGSTIAGNAGNSGGNALSLTNNVTITNASGFIYSGGGGGGGGGGSFHSSFGTSAQGGGGGGGQGYSNSSGGSPNGGTGTNAGAGAGGGGGTASSGGEAPTLWYGGTGGAGGAYATAGSGGASGSAGTTNYAGGAAGAAGLAVQLNSYSITFISGNDSTHVKGAQA
jgi:hypothetical protein